MFYYLLAGASEEERKAFHLKKPEEYHYLSQVGAHTVEMIKNKETVQPGKLVFIQNGQFSVSVCLTCLFMCRVVSVCIFVVLSVQKQKVRAQDTKDTVQHNKPAPLEFILLFQKQQVSHCFSISGHLCRFCIHFWF